MLENGLRRHLEVEKISEITEIASGLHWVAHNMDQWNPFKSGIERIERQLVHCVSNYVKFLRAWNMRERFYSDVHKLWEPHIFGIL